MILNKYIILIILVVGIILLKYIIIRRITYRRMTINDIGKVRELEINSYKDSNDLLPIEIIKKMLEDCPDLCMVAENWNGNIIGVIYGKMLHGDKITSKNIKNNHDPSGNMLTVESTCILHELKRTGMALSMAKYYYFRFIKDSKYKINSICNLTRKEYIKFSEKIGFKLLGPYDNYDKWFCVHMKPK